MKCPECGEIVPVGFDFCGKCGMKLPISTGETRTASSRHCVSCGRTIDWDVNACPYCGHDYSSQSRGGLRKFYGSAGEQSRARTCVSCGRAIDWDVNVCPYCGHDFRVQAGVSGKSYPYIGGGFTLGISIVSLALSLWWLSQYDSYWESTFYEMIYLSWAVCSVIGIVGGVAAIFRLSYPLAVTGSVFELWGSISVFLFGVAFAIVGLVFIAISHRYFRKPK